MHPAESVPLADPPLDALPDHTLEDILTRIPFPSVGAARCVCKRWHSLTTSSAFLALYSEHQAQSESWLYVNGFRYKITDAQALATTTPPTPKSPGHVWGAGGLAYVVQDGNLHYKLSLLDLQWRETAPLPDTRMLPIVAAVKLHANGAHALIVAGGLPSERETSLSTVYLFDSESRTWSPCEDLPAEFHGFSTSRSVTAVVCDRKLYLFHIYTGIVASLDVVTRRWSKVTTLRPPGMQYCYLAVRRGGLLLVGVSTENVDHRFFFRGWNVADGSMECTGPSWPVLCHFASVKTAVDFGNKAKKQEVVPVMSECMDPPVDSHYFVAVSNFLARRISFCAGILGFFDALLEFSKAIS